MRLFSRSFWQGVGSILDIGCTRSPSRDDIVKLEISCLQSPWEEDRKALQSDWETVLGDVARWEADIASIGEGPTLDEASPEYQKATADLAERLGNSPRAFDRAAHERIVKALASYTD